MYKIAFHIQKGGVGKTSLSGNIGHALSLKGKKTVMIDADPQGSLSTWFLKTAPEFELSDVLEGKAAAIDTTVKLNDNLYIIPTFGMEERLKLFSENQLPNKPKAIKNLLKELSSVYDFCIFDLSPGLSLLEKRIIAECNEVITPLTPEFFSLDGIEIFSNNLKRINTDFADVPVKHNRLVINNYNRSFSLHNDIYEAIKKKDFKLYTVNQDRKISDMQNLQQSIFSYPASKTIPELNRLADDLIMLGA
ncbi:MAG: ParA family protein [Bacteroidales bacterium]|jgi:cellulose biosynthesis protein BcsQ